MPPSLQVCQAVSAIFHIFAAALTIFRLIRRFKTHRLWWDDYWALISLIFDTAYFSTLWLRAMPGDPRISQEQRIILFWMTGILYPCVIWTSRFSIAMSIARFIAPHTTARRSLYALVMVFGLLCAVQLIYKTWICTRDSSWHHSLHVQCSLGKPMAIISLTSDVFADTCLTVIPLHLLWRVKLPKPQRILILSIFSSDLLSSLVGVVFAVFLIKIKALGFYSYLIISLTTHIKAATTLCVCNLLVIVTYLYTLFRQGDDLEMSDISETHGMPELRSNATFLTLTEISEMHSSEDSHFYANSLRSKTPCSTLEQSGPITSFSTPSNLPNDPSLDVTEYHSFK